MYYADKMYTDKIFGQPHYSPYSEWHVLAKRYI